MIRISNIALPLDADEHWTRLSARLLNIPEARIKSARLCKKSVDARDKADIHFVIGLDVSLCDADEAAEKALLAGVRRGVQAAQISAPTPISSVRARFSRRPVVVGLGPAGLFAAYCLAQSGAQPVILERGQDVEHRARTVEAFFQGGPLDEDTNIQFGEGGAGAFSDGKLTTGTHDPRAGMVLDTLCACGAPEEIRYLAKPHIGTDRLPGVVKTMREQIVAMGGEVRFRCKLTDIVRGHDGVEAVVCRSADGRTETIPTDALILAVGHSARDTFEMLARLGVPMAAKPFSIGVRIEQLQRVIDRGQYGALAGHPKLGAADYKLNVKMPDGRGVYTFCMCPGGSVVAAASEAGGVVTNGMSTYLRDGRNANSALLVGVEPSDFESDDPLAGVAFQRKWERRAFLAGGGEYRAPAQKVGDFLKKIPSRAPGDVEPTYRPGVTYASLDECLPGFVAEALRLSLIRMDRQLSGFAAPGGLLTGIETRSSSPVRILRDETCRSSLPGLYPCGEGAGYAGGILSAAVDGLRCAQAVLAFHPAI